MRIRRYDIFAIANYLEYLKKGLSNELAKGWAIWKAKVVAARKFGLLNIEKGITKKSKTSNRTFRKHSYNEFPELNGKVQTDEIYDKEIIYRFGIHNYNIILEAVKEKLNQGQKYMQFRDSIRTELEAIIR